MAIHPDLKSLIRESLPEYLFVAEYCFRFRKDASWPQDQVGGCLGYPAAGILFSIVDTIGSFDRGSDLTFVVDDTVHQIKSDGFQHFFVLNSVYYSQTLDEAEQRSCTTTFVAFRFATSLSSRAFSFTP